jgi:DNA-binding XRE family transcriptional regulator
VVNNLKEHILKSGLKQSYIASKLSISPNTLCSYISGRRNPRIDKAQKLAQILNCKVEDIFFANNNYNVVK